MMVITITSKAGGGGRSQATPIKHVYERTD
jgi:hypothetical protein